MTSLHACEPHESWQACPKPKWPHVLGFSRLLSRTLRLVRASQIYEISFHLCGRLESPPTFYLESEAMAETPAPYELIVGESSTQIHSDDGVIAEFSCCDHEANARRWPACVSACKGIPTETLEGYVAHPLSHTKKSAT